MSMILTVLGGFVILAAILAARGYRGRVSTIGVDLGTTFSVVGVNIGNKVQIVSDSRNHTIFPSVVSYLLDGSVIAGYDALERLSTFPLDTIYESKRFIGRSLGEEGVQNYASGHPFNIIEIDDDTISQYSKIGFKLTDTATASGHQQIISPENVGTKILQHLKAITAEYLGHDQVNKAVIAVPAKFDDKQRAATGAAFKAAGLKVVRVIEEPTAAAVAYQLHKKNNVFHILVYDFGGGTLDVSILYVRKGSVEVYATDGDEMLGGSDFDMCLAKGIRDKLEEFSGSKLPDHDINNNDSELCTWPTVRVKAEMIKKDLSSSSSSSVSCNMPSNSNSLKKVSVGFSKEEFHTLCADLFDRSMLPATRLLNELGMKKTEIDEIVLVGGSTRIPRIKELLREFFGKDLNDHIDPDITVAYGAASILD
jgi:molecular chaperone DnaK (HSP70)